MSNYNGYDYTEWMKEQLKTEEYFDEFDLATECCSFHELWEDDMSIPEALIEQARKVFPEESKSE